MKSLTFCSFVLLQIFGFTQSRIVLNNNPFIVINNNAQIVIDNNNANAISTFGTGGNIISEGEFNLIKWNIGTNIGNYIIPFTTISGIKIPLEFNIISAAIGIGNIQFSTYGGSTWNNDLYKPTGVTNMTNIAILNNSSEVIDRFWLIDAQGYATKPTGEIKLCYDDAEHTAIGNTITEADLKAERYDEPTDSWELIPLGGIVNTTFNQVVSIPFYPTDFVRTWTLIDQTTHLLPVILTNFNTSCFQNNILIQWQTLQEINTDYFILEESLDGVYFNFVTQINAQGNSIEEINYSYTTENSSATYYKLSAINLDGEKEEIGIILEECNSTNLNYLLNLFTNDLEQIVIQTYGLDKGTYVLEIFDLSGKLMLQKELELQQYANQFVIEEKRIASSIFILKLYSLNDTKPFIYSRKLEILSK